MTREKKRPRVCFVYYAAFIQLLRREAVTLRNSGYDVDIICLKSFPHDQTFERYDGMNLYKIQSRFGTESTVRGYFSALFLFLVKAFFLVSWFGVVRRYDAVHVTTPPDIAVFTSIIPKLLGARIVLDIHDIGPELYMRKMNKGKDSAVIKALLMAEKIASKYSNHVITVTDMWRDKLVNRSVPEEKCSVIINVPDPEIFCLCKGDAYDCGCVDKLQRTFNLYYHGSLEEHFGVDTLLEAMPLIKQKIPEVVLNIYSLKKGRLQESLVQYVEDHQMADYVKFHNGVPFHELPGILANADIGVVPTKGSTFSDEAVSMKSLEYIFLGIPVVVSRTTAHSYYYNDTMVRFFQPGCSQSLAKGVIELYQDREKMKDLVSNSQTFISQHGWEKAGNDYLQIMTGEPLVQPEALP